MGAKKLSDAQVRQLRTRRVINEEYLPDLAAEYRISLSQALRIVRGEYRAKAGGPLDESPRRPTRRDYSGTKNPNASLTQEDRALVRKLVRDGATHQAVADVMMCARSTITKIMNEPEER